ncbi:MAG TPA: radical SAM protein [Syntrophales bacterium]|nr:radical SAM protein [Syntrophales bacterium]HQG35207.1 radical SAM protein [Syntrophales bacterium]HQI36295.1 radical SAM protein [Syntrophales bacterium]HQJ31456.1 radical SAM protein [Syntrophales bacterium]HRU87895.1 radical SAM protein [Syntrophales bacterium]
MAPDEFPLTNLYLYLSERCNLRCRHCWVCPAAPGEGEERTAALADLKRAIGTAKALGLGRVKLTGGEPLLRKDIVELLRFLRREDLSIDIESNGTMIDREMAGVFRECAVSQVSVSLDGARAERHDRLRGVNGCFEKTVAALRHLREEGITTQVIMSLYKENIPEIEALAALCDEFAVASLKINPVMPTGRGEKVFQRRENVDVEELIGIDRRLEAGRGSRYKTEIYFCLPIGLKSLRAITGENLYECNILHILGILADGTVSICGIGQTETDLNMGNIAVDDLEEIWRHHPLLKKLRAETPAQLSGICGRCIFKFRCLGSCRACAYAVSGDLRSPFFMCEEAYRKNLFPPSRLYDPAADLPAA